MTGRAREGEGGGVERPRRRKTVANEGGRELFLFQVATKKIVVVSAIVGTHCGTIAIMRKPRSRRLFHSRSLSFFLSFFFSPPRSHFFTRESTCSQETLRLALSRRFCPRADNLHRVRVIENCKKLTTARYRGARLSRDVKTYN